MKAFVRSAFASVVGLTAVGSALASVDASLTGRVGYDTNVTAVDENVAEAPKIDSLVVAVGVALGTDLSKSCHLLKGWSAAKLSFASDFSSYANAHAEDFSLHRLGFAGRRQSGADLLTVDTSLTYIDGSESTQTSTSSCNAFGLPVWRDRRTQWQERSRIQWTRTPEAVGWRLTAASTAFDMKTDVRAGRFTFVDRNDNSVTGELGHKLPAGTGWLGAQLGRQNQAAVSLPGATNDYSNNYRRLVLGWAGKTSKGFNWSLSGGPDWRTYTGNINRTLMPDEDRTSWFFEADAAWEVSKQWTLTGRAARALAVASTGKSAFADACIDLGAIYKPTRTLALKIGTKLQQADYFPNPRDDWMLGLSGSADFTVNARLKVGVDVLRQWAWSEIKPTVGRDFERTTLFVRATCSL